MSSNNPLLRMFGRSPFGPLEKQMNKVIECVDQLPHFFNAALKKEWDTAEKLYNKISALEHAADELKKDIRLHLPKGLFLPVSRSDLLEVLVTQDRIANKAKDIAGVMLGRKIEIPNEIAENFQAYLVRSIDATHQARQAINELESLSETAFRGSEVEIVKKMIVELDHIENDTDDIQVKIRRQLFNIENNLPPVNVVFLYKIIEWVGDLADRSHAVGGTLQLLLAR